MKSRNRKANLSILGCCMAIFWSGFIAFGYPGIMSTYWQEMYHVGAAETGAVLTFMLFALAVSMFFSGKIHMKIGMRKCIWIGTLFNIAAMAILMNSTSIHMVYVWGFVINIGCSFIYGPGLTTAQQWQPHRRGLASGILNLVFGISAAIMSPVWSIILDRAGYDKANLILFICVAVTNTAASFLAEVPEKSSLTEEEQEAQQKLLEEAAQKSNALGGSIGKDFTVGQALKTKAFWLIWFTWVFMGAAGVSMVSLSKSYAIYLGLSGVVILTAFNVVNGIGRIIVGTVSDVIGGEKTSAVSFVIAAAGYAMMPHMSSLAGVAAAAACVGLGFGTLFTLTGPIVSGIFGLKYFGMIFGVIFTAYGFVGGIIGPALSGMVLDMTGGSYTIVFYYLAVFALIGAVLMAALKRIRV